MSDIKNTNLIPPSPQIDINSLKPFTKFCCSIGAIPSSYLASWSFEEQLLWFCNYLENTVIPTINNNGEAVAELQGLYEQLKNYVDNYFTNLDVQEEINNKLDYMASSGALYSALQPYIQTTIDNQNNKINNLQNNVNNLSNQLSSLQAGTPIPVSSTAEMSDTSKVYLNTSDGKWYYYSNNNWVAGGVYQATSLSETNEDIINTADFVNSIFIGDNSTGFKNVGGYLKAEPHNYSSENSNYHTTEFLLAKTVMNLDFELFYTETASYAGAVFFDKNKNILQISNNNDYKEIIANNANIYYVRFTMFTGYNEPGDYVPNNLITRNLPYIKNPLSDINFTNILEQTDDLIFNRFLKGSYTYGVFNERTNRLCATGFIKLYPGMNYNININNYVVAIQFFNGFKQYNNRYYDYNTNINFKANDDDLWLLFNIKKSDDTDFTDEEINNINITLTNYSKIKNTNISKITQPNSKWQGKTINFLGDSITAGLGVGQENSWIVNCSNILGANYNNYGISSSTIADYQNLGENNPMCLRYSEMSDDADLIVVLGSRNDYRFVPVPIGTPEDTTNNTFYGAMKTLLNGLWNKYPTKTIVFCTMYKALVNEENTPRDNIWKNQAGYTQDDYNNVIRDLCKQYAIPVIDLYNEGNFNCWNPGMKNAFFQDTVHPNIQGDLYLGEIMAARLQNI